jgi:hypothetical protein
MLTLAFVLLGAAVLLRSMLVVFHLMSKRAAPPWFLAALHGLVGVLGFSCIAFALRGPPRGVAQDAGSFGVIAAVLIGLAALIGVGLFVMRRLKRRTPGILLGIHATIAVGAFVVLLAYVLAG